MYFFAKTLVGIADETAQKRFNREIVTRQWNQGKNELDNEIRKGIRHGIKIYRSMSFLLLYSSWYHRGAHVPGDSLKNAKASVTGGTIRGLSNPISRRKPVELLVDRDGERPRVEAVVDGYFIS